MRLMDLDDLFGQLFSDGLAEGLTSSRRVQLVARMLLGLVGAGLGLAGCVVFLTSPAIGGTPPMRLAMAATFFFLATASTCNLMLGRRWRWPFAGIGISVIALFVSRIVFGA
jgi:hypothetical protein